MDSLEYILGDAGTRWGALRAAQGRVAPWDLTYVTLGNEECMRPWYFQVGGDFCVIAGGLNGAVNSRRCGDCLLQLQQYCVAIRRERGTALCLHRATVRMNGSPQVRGSQAPISRPSLHQLAPAHNSACTLFDFKQCTRGIASASQHYKRFAATMRLRYGSQLKLIANCDFGEEADFDLWEVRFSPFRRV